MGEWLTLSHRGTIHARPRRKNAVTISLCGLGEYGTRISGEREIITCDKCRKTLGMRPFAEEMLDYQEDENVEI
jgi:hypothetical protein